MNEKTITNILNKMGHEINDDLAKRLADEFKKQHYFKVSLRELGFEKDEIKTVGWKGKYDFDENGFPLLNENNFKQVEKEKRANKRYRLTSLGSTGNKHRRTLAEYLYWLKKSNTKALENALLNRDVLYDIVLRLDIENSTNLSKNVTAIAMSDILFKVLNNTSTTISKKTFMEILKADWSTSPTKVKKINKMMNKLVWNIAHTKNKKWLSIINNYGANEADAMSFASKFCYYLNEWYFLGNNPLLKNKYKKKRVSQFSIYDRVVCNALPYYLDVYCGKEAVNIQLKGKTKKYSSNSLINLRSEEDGYKTYLECIDQIITKTKLKPHQIDQILWWCFRENNALLITEMDKSEKITKILGN